MKKLVLLRKIRLSGLRQFSLLIGFNPFASVGVTRELEHQMPLILSPRYELPNEVKLIRRLHENCVRPTSSLQSRASFFMRRIDFTE